MLLFPHFEQFCIVAVWCYLCFCRNNPILTFLEGFQETGDFVLETENTVSVGMSWIWSVTSACHKLGFISVVIIFLMSTLLLTSQDIWAVGQVALQQICYCCAFCFASFLMLFWMLMDLGTCLEIGQVF